MVLIDHEIVSEWFPVLINRLWIVPFDLGSIVTGIVALCWHWYSRESELYLDRYMFENILWSRVITTNMHFPQKTFGFTCCLWSHKDTIVIHSDMHLTVQIESQIIPGYIPEIIYPSVSYTWVYPWDQISPGIPLYPIPVYPWDQISPCILYLGISLRSDIPLYPPVFYTWVYPWDQISPCIPLYPIPGYIPEIRYPLVSW